MADSFDLVCREDLDADFSVRERVRWGDPMAHLAHKKLAEAGAPPPVLPAHLHSKTGGGAVQSWPNGCKDIGPLMKGSCLQRFDCDIL